MKVRVRFMNLMSAQLFLLVLIPFNSFSQETLELPDDKEIVQLTELYKTHKIKEVKIYRKEYSNKDTATTLGRHLFINKDGKVLQEKDLGTKKTILNFFKPDGTFYRNILFINDNRTNSTYFYYNKNKKLIATELYDRLDSLSIRNYFNYLEKKGTSSCITTTSKGDTVLVETVSHKTPESFIYQRFTFSHKLQLEIIYTLNKDDQIIRKSINDIAHGKYEGWGFAYDEEGNRFLGELYNANQELLGTKETFYYTHGLAHKEIFRNGAGRTQYELVYEYVNY